MSDTDLSSIARKNARINALVTRLAEAEEVVKAAKALSRDWDAWEDGEDGPDDLDAYVFDALTGLRAAVAAYDRDKADD